MTQEIMCACGRPLHYSDAKAQRFVEQMVADLGECIEVDVLGRKWRVPRHYIALHGLRAIDLPALAEEYGFEEVQ